MLKNIFLFSLIVFACAMASSVYAGKVELTTYYPAPFGEYQTLTTTQGANLATTSGNVGIGTSDPQGILDVTSTTSAFYPPRVTTAQRNSIADPQPGAVVYNSDSGYKTLEVFDGSDWSAPGVPVRAWQNVTSSMTFTYTTPLYHGTASGVYTSGTRTNNTAFEMEVAVYVYADSVNWLSLEAYVDGQRLIGFGTTSFFSWCEDALTFTVPPGSTYFIIANGPLGFAVTDKKVCELKKV